MAETVRADLQCGICIQRVSPHIVKGSDPASWAIMTGCGHIYHEVSPIVRLTSRAAPWSGLSRRTHALGGLCLT